MTLQIQSMLTQVNASLESMRKVRQFFDHRMAFDFNATSLFGPGENQLSSLVAFFMNPKGSHAQGRLFLKLFLHRFWQESSDDSKDVEILTDAATQINVYTESRTDETRRIDILVEFSRQGQRDILAIENKVFAADQHDQIKHYSSFLNKKTNGRFKLFYLTPDGHMPSGDSIDDISREELEKTKQFGLLSYSKDLVDLFDEFARQCQADRVRFFAEDISTYFKRRFEGEKFMGDGEAIAQVITKDPENMLAALQVSHAMPQLRQAIWNLVKDQLSNHDCVKNGKFELLEFQNDLSLLSRPWGAPFVFQPENWNVLKITYTFERPSMVSLIKVIHFKNMPDSEQEKKNLNDFLTMARNQLTPRWNQSTQNCNIYRGTQAVPMSWCNDGQVQPWLDMLHNDGNDSHSKFLDEIFQEMSSDVNDLTRLANQYGFKL